MVGDAGRTIGIQRITFSRGAKSGEVTVVVENSTVYIRGAAFVLASFMGFPAAISKRYAERWISVPHTSSGFSTFAGGVLLAPRSQRRRFRAVHASSFDDPRRTEGDRYRSPSAWPKGQFTVNKLYALDGSKPLPVQSVVTQGLPRNDHLQPLEREGLSPSIVVQLRVTKLNGGAPA